jgi:hypothetical protein
MQLNQNHRNVVLPIAALDSKQLINVDLACSRRTNLFFLRRISLLDGLEVRW